LFIRSIIGHQLAVIVYIITTRGKQYNSIIVRFNMEIIIGLTGESLLLPSSFSSLALLSDNL
jgi:hypothetical protein